mgnify:CR=1 FL=1
MATVIKIKRSETPNQIPGAAALEAGELAMNLTDGKLFSKTSGGVVKEVGGAGAVTLQAVTQAGAVTNNDITLNILESLRLLKITPLLIICSTSEVYGNVSLANQPISEKNYIAPINPYAASKTFQDLISQVYKKIYGSKVIITRMFSYTNARRSNLFQSAFAKQILEIENKKKKYLFHGNLKSKRTFMDIEDAMNAYWLCAKKGKIGEVYNIGGNKTISIENFLNELIKISKTKIITKLNPKLLRPLDVNVQIPNSNKFKKDTGWRINVSFKESVKKLLNELRSNL